MFGINSYYMCLVYTHATCVWCIPSYHRCLINIHTTSAWYIPIPQVFDKYTCQRGLVYTLIPQVFGIYPCHMCLVYTHTTGVWYITLYHRCLVYTHTIHVGIYPYHICWHTPIMPCPFEQFMVHIHLNHERYLCILVFEPESNYQILRYSIVEIILISTCVPERD